MVSPVSHRLSRERGSARDEGALRGALGGADNNGSCPLVTSVHQGTPNCVFAFGSSGWLFIWYLGVIKCIKEHNLHKNAYCIGSSGGSITGGTLFCDVIGTLDALARYVLTCASEARGSLFGNFHLRRYVRVAIERHTPEELARILNGRMEISVTRITWGGLVNHRIKKFESYEAMKQAMLASACLVPLAGFPMKLGELGYCFDGGLTDFNPIGGWRTFGTFSGIHHVVPMARRRGDDAETNAPCTVSNDNTLLVRACPFYCSRAHIVPEVFVPPWWAIYPPAPDKLWELYHMGYRDAARWLRDARRDGNGGNLPDLTENAAEVLRQHEERTSSASPRDANASSLRRSSSWWNLMHDEIAPETVGSAMDITRFFARILSLQLVFFELVLHAIFAIAALFIPLLRGIGPDGLPQSSGDVLSRLRTYVQGLLVVALAQLPGYHTFFGRRRREGDGEGEGEGEEDVVLLRQQDAAQGASRGADPPAPEPKRAPGKGSSAETTPPDWNLRQLSFLFRVLGPVVRKEI
ncbi:hypothetical protein PPROV_000436100 [Pycnococcus provasolii]|uniref:Patatin n=1 Tax=Pycnococcus provasolii TaxID=41880 RepID=A0A830HJ71_9CHLO|nr:hypothetical protein PPROV_000436100 [Pycnococcus provasolii]